MILVTGGNCQGKREFSQRALIHLPQGEPVVWCDGSSAYWEAFMKEKYGWNFHLFIRRVLLGEAGMLPGRIGAALFQASQEKEHTWIWEELERLTSFLVESLLEEREDRILVTDDIGYGIVPSDYFERVYREETGRICCETAAKASEVWRVCCGLGQRIK